MKKLNHTVFGTLIMSVVLMAVTPEDSPVNDVAAVFALVAMVVGAVAFFVNKEMRGTRR